MSTLKKTTKRLAPENLSEIEVHNCRCHFRGFQLELHIVDTKNFEIGSVVEKLQRFEKSRNVKNFGPLTVRGGKSRNRSLITESSSDPARRL